MAAKVRRHSISSPVEVTKRIESQQIDAQVNVSMFTRKRPHPIDSELNHTQKKQKPAPIPTETPAEEKSVETEVVLSLPVGECIIFRLVVIWFACQIAVNNFYLIIVSLKSMR